jgi:hypothetical protein
MLCTLLAAPLTIQDQCSGKFKLLIGLDISRYLQNMYEYI